MRGQASLALLRRTITALALCHNVTPVHGTDDGADADASARERDLGQGRSRSNSNSDSRSDPLQDRQLLARSPPSSPQLEPPSIELELTAITAVGADDDDDEDDDGDRTLPAASVTYQVRARVLDCVMLCLVC